MSQDKTLTLIGAVPSPYTRKMVALLRYRHLKFRIIWDDPVVVLKRMKIALPKVALLPTCLMADEAGEMRAVCDSTPIIRRLDTQFTDRRVIPADPALAFIDYLLEDFADEWCTKYMFHYRWASAEDADNAGTLLPLFQKIDMSAEMFKQFKPFVTERQVSRLHVVGSSKVTAPLIDASYRRFLSAMESHLEQQPFMLGHRPGACDFALYGQLTQLVGFDPTSRAIAHDIAPRVVAWTGLMEDQCGLDPTADAWNTLEQAPQSLTALLNEVGRVYAPALLANATALAKGDKTWQAAIDGGMWSQQTFAYQGKCLKWINSEYQLLSAGDKARVDVLLAGTGCEILLS
jgi:glutathione S-transferase